MLKSKPLATHRIFSCILLPSLIHPLLSVVNSKEFKPNEERNERACKHTISDNSMPMFILAPIDTLPTHRTLPFQVDNPDPLSEDCHFGIK